jgi:hypothetical protein
LRKGGKIRRRSEGEKERERERVFESEERERNKKRKKTPALKKERRNLLPLFPLPVSLFLFLPRNPPPRVLPPAFLLILRCLP